jgi:hypothetical protein
MTERACIFRHDRTTANGIVLDGLDDMNIDDRKPSYSRAWIQSPIGQHSTCPEAQVP